MKTSEELLEDWKSVQYRMKEEGFDYCFLHYSNFAEIEDFEFHKLRLNYIKAMKELESYVIKKVSILKDLE